VEGGGDKGGVAQSVSTVGDKAPTTRIILIISYYQNLFQTWTKAAKWFYIADFIFDYIWLRDYFKWQACNINLVEGSAESPFSCQQSKKVTHYKLCFPTEAQK